MADTRAYRMSDNRSRYMSMPVNVLGLIDIMVVVSISLSRRHIIYLSLLLHDLELNCRLHNLNFMDGLVAVAVAIAMARMQNFVIRSLMPVLLFLVTIVLFRGGSGVVTIAIAISIIFVVALLLVPVVLFR